MAKLRMEELDVGQTLIVLATDPEAPIDLAAWAADEGHVFAARTEGEYELRKGAARQAGTGT